MTIEIINPIPGKGLGRTYKVSPNYPELDEDGYVEIGAIIRDASGNTVKDADVQVTATDDTQNKEMTGTGSITPIYPNGDKIMVPYYAYHYEFKTPGDHVITFTVGDTHESVTIHVN